jgi:prepilin peptidase CpaA
VFLLFEGSITLVLALYLCKTVATDLSQRIIKNQDVLVIFCLCLVIGFFTRNYSVLAYSFSIFIVGYLLFVAGVWGGGDVKLIVAVSLAVPSDLQIDFITSVLMVGGGVAIFILVSSKIFKRPEWKDKGVPYALPISVCGLYYITHSLLSL